jgi:hypothetical protein
MSNQREADPEKIIKKDWVKNLFTRK